MKNETRLVVINLMPEAEKYPDYLSLLLPEEIDIQWVRLHGHPYRSSCHTFLNKTHQYYEDIDINTCDALLLSGAPLDHQVIFEDAYYWHELADILNDARKKVGSISGLCWGAMALAYLFYGLNKQIFDQKLFGVYAMECKQPNHPLTIGLNTFYPCPQSRYAQVDPVGLEKAIQSGQLIVIDENRTIGPVNLSSPEGDVVLFQGHHDYPANRLAEEYHRALERGKKQNPPVNYSLDQPIHTWQQSSQTLFKNWLILAKQRKEIIKHSMTPHEMKQLQI